MKDLYLYNTTHPLAESGKPIFIPFGEWRYDDARRQRLDRAHGERIANELNARVAKGEPGIPVYQGHPDVPELAAKYPDKGALGWVTKIELANESGKDGLALTVEWDRDPGKGFKWFSPYWLANEREGSTYIVGRIASIGLVNNPNIPEFRLANEEQNMKTKKLNPAIIELAAKHDRLANSVDANGMEHVDAGVPEGGQFTGERSGGGGSGKSSGGGSSGGKKPTPGFFSKSARAKREKEDEERRSRLDSLIASSEASISKIKADRAKRSAEHKKRIKELSARYDELYKTIHKGRMDLKRFNDRSGAPKLRRYE